MARPKTTDPKLYPLSDGTYCVNIEGRRQRLGRDKDEAERKRRRLVAEWLATGQVPRAKPMGPTVNDALLAYLREALSAHEDNRQRARIKAAVGAVKDLYGLEPASAFDQLALQAVRQSLLQRTDARAKRPEKKLPLSRRYVNHLVKCVQAAWVWLESQKLVPNGSADALRTVKALRKRKGGRETKRIVAVPDWVVDATLPEMNPVVRAMVQVERLTGMRPGEVCALRRCDLSLSPEEKIEVPDTDPPMTVSAVSEGGILVWAYVPDRHKTLYKGKRRIVPVGPQAQEVLLPFLARDPEAYLFSAREASDLVREALGRGKRYAKNRMPKGCYTTQSYGRSVAKAVRRANRKRQEPLPPWRPNMLRKAAATLSDELADRDTTMALLGHAVPETSAIYAEAAFRRAARFVAGNG